MNIIVDSHGISLSSDADVLEDLYLQIERETVSRIMQFEEIFLILVLIFQGLHRSDFYFIQNGKKITELGYSFSNIYAILRLRGGKGGFGSMLRAIGAQIEKTTNREACRDLSGRRLRDINEEKRIRDWLEKQKNAPEDQKVKFQKKIEKLLSKPKHDFKDEDYEQQRTELTQNIDEAVEQGFKKVSEAAATSSGEKNLKRKAEDNSKSKKKKKKAKGLWFVKLCELF